MSWRAQIDDRGVITRYKDTDSGETISAKEYERRMQMHTGVSSHEGGLPQMHAASAGGDMAGSHMMHSGGQFVSPTASAPIGIPGTVSAADNTLSPTASPLAPAASGSSPLAPTPIPGLSPSGIATTSPQATIAPDAANPLIQPGAQLLSTGAHAPGAAGTSMLPPGHSPSNPPTAGQSIQNKNLRMEGVPQHTTGNSHGYKAHGFLDATSIAILLPTLVLLALIIAAAHKKRLFPWQTIRTFNPPSGLLSPREYERSFLCPPNLRRHGRLGKRNPNAHWTDQDGIVIPFGFLARTHLPVTIPLGRLPNKNMFIVAPSGSGKTTLMRAVIKALLAKPCVIIALEAKANDPNLDERREGFKYTVLPEAEQAGFDCLYFNPLDADSIHWNPLELDPITFASSIVQDVNSLPPEEQHWAERDHGYITGLCTLLKWGAVQVQGEDENGQASELQQLPCNPRGLMRLVNNRRNIVESLRKLKSNPNIDAGELNELTQTLSSIIRTDNDWDKNIQGVRGRLRMFKNPNVLRVTERSNVDIRSAMHRPTVLIFGAPASLGPDAESLASCFVYQLQQALHTRYGTASVLPLFAFFDEYQTLNMDIAGRLSAIVRGANGGLAIILQNISQIAGKVSADPVSGGELKTIFSNSAIRVCLHNADESTAKFFSDEIGKHAVIVPGISDHYDAKGFGIFPSTWNRIHSQQVVARVDTDSIKRMEKQHALVYLSPAGDPEFGETKPFMVDLRGIEEIAKLHLLHNVAGRMQPPGGPAGPNGGPGGGNGGPGLGGLPIAPVAPIAGMPDSGPVAPSPAAVPAQAVASVKADRLCPHCGQAAGKGRFCIECGRPLANGSANGGAGSGSPVVPASAPAPAAAPAPAFAQAAQPFEEPVAQRPFPTREHLSQPAEPAAARQATPASGVPNFARAIGAAGAAQPANTTPALPPHVAMQAAAREQQQRELPPGVAPAAPTAAHREAPVQRQPVTSLNPDLAKLGVPQAAHRAAEPQAKPAPAPVHGGGVEF